MKLSSSLKNTREATKWLKIDTSSLEVETKEKDCTALHAKSIIFFFLAFYVYTQIFVFLAPKGNKL